MRIKPRLRHTLGMVDDIFSPNRLVRRIQSRSAALALGISQRVVEDKARRGELPGAAKIGGVWTFDPEKLAAFIAEREREAEARGTNVYPLKPAVRRQTRAQTNASYQRLMAGRNKVAQDGY